MSSDMETSREWTGPESNQLTLFVEGFPAPIFPVLDDVQASLLAASLASGANSLAASLPSNPTMPSSRTLRASSAEETMSQPADAALLEETTSPATWTPPPWRNAAHQRESFAHLADGLWTTGQRNLCTSRGWDEYSETWPLSGMMQNGNVYQRPPLVPRTSDTELSLWPTPMAQEGPGGQVAKLTDMVEVAEGRLPRYYRGKETESCVVPLSPNGPTGQLNPTWVEWLMGFPIGWTDSAVSGMLLCPSAPSG